MYRLKTIYYAGWRAGKAGASYRDNLGKNWFTRILWDNGWHTGMVERLSDWLRSKAF